MSKGPSSSSTNTPAGSSTPAAALSNVELDRLLNREASAIQRELEVDRILNAFKLKYVFALLAVRGVLYLTFPLLVHMTSST